MSKASRRKGSEFELAVAKRISAWWGGTFRRTPMSGGWAKGGADGKGVLRGDLVQMDGPLFPFSVECKAQELWSIDAFVKNPDKSLLTKFLQQCWAGAADEGKIPLLIAKRNSQPLVVFMPWGEFPHNEADAYALIFVDRFGTKRQAAFLKLDDLVKIPSVHFTTTDPPPARRKKKF